MKYISLILIATAVLYGGFSHTVRANDDAPSVGSAVPPQFYSPQVEPLRQLTHAAEKGEARARLRVAQAPVMNHQAIISGLAAIPGMPGEKKSRQKRLLHAESKPGNTPGPIDAPGNISAFSSPKLASVELGLNSRGTFSVRLKDLPGSSSRIYKNIVGQTRQSDLVVFTTAADLQAELDRLIKAVSSPHAVAIAMRPSTGEILALSEKTTGPATLASSATFPAASLFKIITAEAALRTGALNAESEIRFRGGTYTLNKWNYLPNSRQDNRKMTLSEALGASCNPAFARIALQHLKPGLLQEAAERFGFNSSIPFDAELERSTAAIPDSKYEFSRTAAGFGDVFISPVHAAVLISALANSGVPQRPRLVNRILAEDGATIYNSSNISLRAVTTPRLSNTLLSMMEATTTTGTSRKEFLKGGKTVLGTVRVAGKTGTLRGKNPYGINNWFIGAAPISNPEIAVAVVVVDPNRISSRASRVARQIFEFYFSDDNRSEPVS